MGRTSLALVGLTLFLSVVVSPQGYASDDAETRSLLRIVRAETRPEAFRAAVAQLGGGTPAQQQRLRETLLDVARVRHRSWRAAAAKVHALTARLGDGRRSAKKLRAWEAARQAANEWIFDEERFPVPEQSVITGPQAGYGQAKSRGDKAMGAWRALRRSLSRCLKPALALSAKKAKALGDAWRSSEATYRLVAAELPARGDLVDLEEPVVDPLAEHLLALRRGVFADAARAYAELPAGWRKLCLFHAYAQAVLDWNDDHEFDMDAGGLAGIAAINAYRIPLGISPLSHNERLARAAHGHSEEMTKLGYFSHRSPLPKRATKELRVALEGYTAQVVECITGVGGGEAAVEFWKYDGGHHRDMVDPKWVEGGMSSRGPAVYNGGRGEDGSIPAFRY